MATRSMIGIKDVLGVNLIYCHWDGYPEWVGKTLKQFYDTEEKVRELLELGDLSSLGETLEKTCAYHRDRGEDLNPARYCSDKQIVFKRADNCGAEYVYLFHTDTASWESMAVTRNGLRACEE